MMSRLFEPENMIGEDPESAKKSCDKLDKDFKLLEATRERFSRLNQVYKALLTVKPTSTSCERAFSVAGSFKTKVRNRLAPTKLMFFCDSWLKNFFLA